MILLKMRSELDAGVYIGTGKCLTRKRSKPARDLRVGVGGVRQEVCIG